MLKFLKRTARAILNSPRKFREKRKENALEKNPGFCVICEEETVFVVHNEWLRDFYKCKKCGTIPRNRALVNSLNLFSPDWKNLQLHESSPGGAVSDFLKKKCAGYSSSHYYSDVPRGEFKDGHRSEDLHAMTFPDETFDIFITSDVFEHVFEPDKAFSEIARILKPGGMHIFTMPWYPELKQSRQRTKMSDGKEIHLLEPVYHGNPISGNGSIVTFDWGLDFTDFISRNGGMSTTIYLEIDRKKGIDGKFLEVFISRKGYGK